MTARGVRAAPRRASRDGRWTLCDPSTRAEAAGQGYLDAHRGFAPQVYEVASVISQNGDPGNKVRYVMQMLRSNFTPPSGWQPQPLAQGDPRDAWEEYDGGPERGMGRQLGERARSQPPARRASVAPPAKPAAKQAANPAPRPAPKPVAKPAPKYVAKPAPKPATKPVAKPVPAAKPAAKPAASRPAGRQSLVRLDSSSTPRRSTRPRLRSAAGRGRRR